MQDLQREIVLDHFRRPRNRGELQGADVEERIFNPLCGDEVTVYANLRDAGLARVAFTGRGCAISQASASMLAERLEGSNLEDAEAEIAAFMEMMGGTEENAELGELAALKAIITAPNRIRCATLAWEAMRRGLEGYAST